MFTFFKNVGSISLFVQNQPSNDRTLSGLESGCIKYIKVTDAAGVAQFHLRGNISSSSLSRRTDATASSYTRCYGQLCYGAMMLRAGANYDATKRCYSNVKM